MEFQKFNKNPASIWWLNPICIYGVLTLLTIYSYSIDSSKMLKLYDERNFINIWDVLLYIIFYLSFCVGFWANSKVKKTTEEYDYTSLYIGYKWLAFLTIGSYVIWIINLLFMYNSDFLLNLLISMGSQYSIFKDPSQSGRISGITTLSEIGIVAVPVGIYILKEHKVSKRKRKFVYRTLTMMFILSLVRAVLAAERISFLELLIPSIIVLISFYKKPPSLAFKFFPVIALFILFVVFGLFEFNRSWIYYEELYNGNFMLFVADRLSGYYSLAINTECIQINFLPVNYFPLYTLEIIWRVPGMNEIPSLFLGNSVDYLDKWGNPEYNNPGGLLAFYRDFGIGGIILQVILGNIISRFYKLFICKDMFGVVVYSFMIFGMLELPRYPFFTCYKMFYILIGLWILKKITFAKNNTQKSRNYGITITN